MSDRKQNINTKNPPEVQAGWEEAASDAGLSAYKCQHRYQIILIT